MAQPQFITGLDIGSSAIRIVTGQLLEKNDGVDLQIIAAADAPAGGISKGIITSIEDATASVSYCLEKVERMIGTTLSSTWVGISGQHIITEESRGVIAVSKPDGEIKEEDVERAIDAARTVATPLNYEILHVIPRSFTIDGQPNIKDPIGMTGIRLEVDAQIIQGLSSQIKNLTKCIYRTGLDIEDLVLSILATCEAVITKRQKELGVMVVNIGSSTTSFAVFEEGDLLHSGVVPIGGDHITKDLAICLRSSVDVAERVKLEYGAALSRDLNKKDEISLAELGGENDFASRKYVAEIIEARVEEIYDRLDKELKKIGRSGMLPAGVVLTGGGAKLNGLVEAAKEKLKLPASLGYPIGFMSAVDKINDPAFATAAGLVVWGAQAQKGQTRGGFGGIMSRLGNVGQASTVFKKWIKSLMP
ncbi:MAG: cell division protein FtsA [bacterium]|nr:cell division protein FtsA [bacterium]